MNIYYTIDEKYIKAVNKIAWRQFAKAKLLLEEILEQEPDYAKAHYQLGCIYCYELINYKRARFHFDLCIKFDPAFPFVYFNYLELLNTLGKQNELLQLADRSLKVEGVCKSCVYNEMGISFEQIMDLEQALKYYQLAEIYALEPCDLEKANQNKKRVEDKKSSMKSYVYSLV